MQGHAGEPEHLCCEQTSRRRWRSRLYALTQRQVEGALLASGQNGGGGALERGGEQAIVRVDGPYRTVDAVAQQVVATPEGGNPVLVKDVATVRDGRAFRLSAATENGLDEVCRPQAHLHLPGVASPSC